MTSRFKARSRVMGLLLAGLIVIAGLMAGKAASAAGNGTIQISPPAQTVPGTFTVTIQTNVNVVISGAQTDYTFDRTKLQITNVARGSAWPPPASFVMGVVPQTQADAIAESNTTGRLKNIALFFAPGDGSVPSGVRDLVTITMRGIQCTNSSLGVDSGEILDANGAAATVSYSGGSANVALDTDADGQCDGVDLDDDNDGFSDVIEVSTGTNPLVRCGTNAWPADINNDTFVDIIGDISALTGAFAQSVPPAPARYDIAPDPPDGFIDVIGDIARLSGLFGQGCA